MNKARIQRATQLACDPEYPPKGAPWFRKHYLDGRRDHLRVLIRGVNAQGKPDSPDEISASMYKNPHGDPSRHSSYEAGWNSVNDVEKRYIHDADSVITTRIDSNSSINFGQQTLSRMRQQLGAHHD